MKKLLLLFVLFVSFSIQAQETKTEKILNLFDVNGKQAEYAMLFNAYASNKINKTEKVDEALSKLADVYSKVLSEVQVEDMITFYKSNTGKTLINNRAAMTADQQKEYDDFIAGDAMQTYIANKTEIATKERAIRKNWIASFKR
ncbi:hypothetical protein SAMN05216480_101735 [Pustulibacterium marinum]|uniref:DUF2059 domain-containing protein n=1 Tax=Pustulibacterium marinum TaxID=1224947 RepID=A0A1I7F8B2_9FLAO|nr:DUF2059 domain-containing protein [Pustulibacterium marinum]SFU32431.1 hypothetical protein SAMN05216480_101735 [Pustulibacterium marinum]